MTKLAQMVVKKFQSDLNNDEPLQMNVELFWRWPFQSHNGTIMVNDELKPNVADFFRTHANLCTNCG